MPALLWLSLLFAVAAGHIFQGNDMPEIKIDIGENVHETAKRSGAPRYSTRNIAGLVSYALVDMPPDIPVHYHRQGYEITALPLYSLRLYADEENANDLAVQTVALQFAHHAVNSHVSAQTFVGALIAQFQNSKWKRFISEFCPAVTGRSAFLNESGEPDGIGNCALDPGYRLPSEDWVRLMEMTQNYKWIGDGVLATLTVGYSDDIRGITYSIHLEFDDFALKRHRNETNLARKLAEGDAQGRNSTIKDKDAKLARKSLVKILEDNARKRGDTVLPR